MKTKHLLLCFLFFTSFHAAFAQIDSIVNIPDAVFKQKVVDQADLNNDNEIQLSEAAIVDGFGFDNWGIKSLVGIEAFTNIEYLYVKYNSIQKLDLSRNTKLKSLECDGNRITEMNLKKCKALIKLTCSANLLTNLDISENDSLKHLECGYNKLVNLDISNNQNLISVYCESNQLTNIDLTKNLAIYELYCNQNLLTILDITNNKFLAVLECDNNKLTRIDITNNQSLRSLTCTVNQLSSLDFCSFGRNIEYLYCTSNPNLKTVSISDNKRIVRKDNFTELSDFCYSISFPDSNFKVALIKSGVDSNNDNLIQVSEALATKVIYVKNQSIVSLNGIEKFKNLVSLNCDSNSLSSLDVSKNLYLTDLDCRFNPNLKTICAQSIHYADSLFQKDSSAIWAEKCDLVIIPDSNFKAALIKKSLDLNNDKEIQEFEALKATTLNVNNESIKSLVGIEKFINLTSLSCDSNNIVTINLSQNTSVLYLSCAHNLITGLNLSKNTALTHLDGSQNQLAVLDISKNTNLAYLNFQSNKLKYIKTANNKALTSLNGKNNLLTSLDVSSNKVLESLDCSSNSLYVLDLSNNTSLVQMSSKNNPLKSICVASVKDAESKFLKDSTAVWTELCIPIPYAHFLVEGIDKAWLESASGGNRNAYYTVEYQTRTFGDTLINGIVYKLVAKSSCSWGGGIMRDNYSTDYNPHAYRYALREDTTNKKVNLYAITKVDNLNQSEEYLLYDFNLNQGDTSKCINNKDEIVLSVDYLVVSGTLRKRINFSKNSWIEGIGNPNSLYNESENYAKTYIEGGVCLFGDCTWTLCSIVTGLQDNYLSDNVKLEIIPNPANKSIKLNLSDLNKLTIYNQAGISVKEISNNIGDEISIEDLPDGLYFVKTERNNQILTSKLIIRK